MSHTHFLSLGLRKEFFYLRRHPVTDDVRVTPQEFIWNEASGEWDLPPEQPTLPYMVEGTDYYVDEDEAIAARAKLLAGELEVVDW